MVQAIVESVRAGWNVIDTAVNYRQQKGERCVGKALAELDYWFSGGVTRDEVVIATKAGFIPGDAEAKDPPRARLEWTRKLQAIPGFNKFGALRCIRCSRFATFPPQPPATFAATPAPRHCRWQTLYRPGVPRPVTQRLSVQHEDRDGGRAVLAQRRREAVG